MEKVCYQINFQATLGGGEIFTRFFTAALAELGWRSVLLVARDATYWRDLMPAGTEFRPVWDSASILEALPRERSLIVSHTVLPQDIAADVAMRHCLTGLVHMPLYDREPRGLTAYHRLFVVSEHVKASAVARGLRNVHDEPLLGVADLSLRPGSASVAQTSPYEWDERKFRDRLFGWMERHTSGLRSRTPYRRPDGLVLGIVSRLTPIKQFPQLFTFLAPILAQRQDVRLEVFGAGGYASVRDLRQALRPLGDRARFWGLQSDVAAVYPQLDYVLSGFPEKEALGLNIIEAQQCGTPVLAVGAPPFTETVVDGASGFLYRDPREDGGADFAALLQRLDRASRPDPRQATAHLARFAMPAFTARVGRAIEAAIASQPDAAPG